MDIWNIKGGLKMILSNFKKIIIPCFYRQGLKDDDISEEFITDCLNRLRSFGEDIPTGPIELVDILETGDIEIFIEC